MVKFLLERIAPVHIDTESIRYCVVGINPKIRELAAHTHARAHTSDATFDPISVSFFLLVL